MYQYQKLPDKRCFVNETSKTLTKPLIKRKFVYCFQVSHKPYFVIFYARKKNRSLIIIIRQYRNKDANLYNAASSISNLTFKRSLNLEWNSTNLQEFRINPLDNQYESTSRSNNLSIVSMIASRLRFSGFYLSTKYNGKQIRKQFLSTNSF